MTPREIDALVAKEIFGWTDVRQPRAVQPRGIHGRTYRIVPRYSSSFNAAFQVVEKMRAMKRYVAFGPSGFEADGITPTNDWEVEITGDPTGAPSPYAVCVADTSLPRAIAIAALKAVGVEVET